MGQGHTGAEDKVSSSLHMFSMECWDTEQLLKYLDEFQSFTSDMGTEVKITDFAIDRDRLDLIMPTWLSTMVSRAPPQAEALGDAECQHYHNPLEQCSGRAFLRNAMPIPGSGHMVHNVIKGLPESMSHYKSFLEDLKTVEKALTHPGRRDRIIAKCLAGTCFSFSANKKNKTEQNTKMTVRLLQLQRA